MRFMLRLVITAIALWSAVALIPGIEYQGEPWKLLLVALVFGAVNALIRPMLVILSCPLIVLTLGLFVFVLNALMLWITGQVSTAIGLGFHVSGSFAAVFGGIVVGLVSTALNLMVGAKPESAH